MQHITPEDFQAIQAIVSAEASELSRSEQDALTLFFASLVEEQRAEEQQRPRQQSKRHKPKRRKGRRAA